MGDSDRWIELGVWLNGLGLVGIVFQETFREFLIESGLEPNSPYYNAGVMLVNLVFWRKHDIQKQLIDYYIKKGHFSVDDQGVLNGVLADSTVRLPYKYNAMKPIFTRSYKQFCHANLPIGFTTSEEFYEAKNNPVIVHFNGPALRPWMKWCGHPFTGPFRKCLYKHFPNYKLWTSNRTKSFVLKQYIWNRFLSRLSKYINY